MTRIDELIRELCPNGIEYKPIGDVARLVRGNGMPKTDLTSEGVGAIHYGQIYTRYGAWAAETFSFVAPDTAAKLTRVDPGDVIITNTSENVDDVGKAVAWLGSESIVTGGHATVIKHAEDAKFLSYWFASEEFSVQKRKLATGTKVIDVSAKQLATVRIPIPPRTIQVEIVRVLDRYSELERELEVALDAELKARRAQYGHYRQLMLDRVDAEMAPVSTLGKWFGGVTPSTTNTRYWEDGSIPWLASMDVSDETTDGIRGRVTDLALAETSLRVIPAPSVVVVMRSNILRRRLPIGFVKVDTTVNQDIRALVPRAGVDAEYVYQALRADSERIRRDCVRTDGSMAAVDSKAFFDWTIPLPSMEEQMKISENLQKLEFLVSDLSSGLPAELRARRKQYDHYRDRLLTFPERVA